MKVMVLGAGGLVGQEVCCQLERANEYDLVTVGRNSNFDCEIDLNDSIALGSVLEHMRPDAIINCAGKSTSVPARPYESFTNTLLEQTCEKRLLPSRIILLGSVAVHGAVPDRTCRYVKMTVLR
jgi:nucleoside-diphosphate-sugar epimerase